MSARSLRSRCVAGFRDDRRVVNVMGRGEMVIGLALCVIPPRSMPGWSIDASMCGAMVEYLVEHGISRECVVVEK